VSWDDEIRDRPAPPAPHDRLRAALAVLDREQLERLAEIAENLAADRRRIVRELDADERPIGRMTGAERCG
jgi:hypothetical protein